MVGVPLGYTTWSMVFSGYVRPPRLIVHNGEREPDDDAFDALRL